MSAGAARVLARAASVAAAAEVLISLATVLTGGFRLQVAGLRVSSGLWSRPLMQAAWLGAASAGLYYRDATLRGQWDAVPRGVQRILAGPVTEVRQRLLWATVAVGSIASLLVCYRLARHAIVLGSVEGGWVYGYFQAFSAKPLAVFAIVSAICGAALAVSDRPTRRNEWSLVLLWIVAGTIAQAIMTSLTPFTLGGLFTGDTSNSFYSVTRQYGASAVLADFARLRDHWPIHAHSNLPGKLMLIYALEGISIDPGVLAWLVVLFSNLGGVLLYLFVRDLFDDRRVALYSLALYLFVPGKLFFFPVMNIATPAVVLGFACLMLRWLRTARVVWAAAAGVCCFGLVFFEPMPLVMGLLFALLIARALWRGDLTWALMLRHTGTFVVAFLATYAIVRMASGFDLFDALRLVGGDAGAFNARAGREYHVWVRQNVTDFLFAAGVCQTVLFLPALIDGVSNVDDRRRVIGEPIVILCAGVAAALVALDLAGINRGEVTRLWIFLACFFQIPAAWVCARLGDRRAIALVLATTILQIAIASAVVKFNVP